MKSLLGCLTDNILVSRNDEKKSMSIFATEEELVSEDLFI